MKKIKTFFKAAGIFVLQHIKGTAVLFLVLITTIICLADSVKFGFTIFVIEIGLIIAYQLVKRFLGKGMEFTIKR